MSGPILNNTLADAAERAGNAWRASRAAECDAIARAIEAGAILAAARDEAPHGTWGAFLRRAGIGERQAQRLIQLARSRLKPDTVSGLGGIRAALAFLPHAVEGRADEHARALIEGRRLRTAESRHPGIVAATLDALAARQTRDMRRALALVIGRAVA